MARFDFAYCLATRKFPLLEVEHAAAIEVEALQEFGLILFPFRQQCADVGAKIEFAVGAANGDEVSERVDAFPWQQQPFRVAIASLSPGFFSCANNFGAFRIDHAMSALIGDDERFAAGA